MLVTVVFLNLEHVTLSLCPLLPNANVSALPIFDADLFLPVQFTNTYGAMSEKVGV